MPLLSSRSLARVAGVLYLLVGIFGGFAQGYFQPLLYVAGNPAASFNQVVAHASLVPWGVVADLTQATVFVFLALVLHRLLVDFGSGRARAMLVLVVIAVAIMTLNNAFEWGAYRVALAPEYASALGLASQQALTHLLLELQHTGVLIAQIFFGLWLVPLGLLAWESRLFPRWLAVLLVTGGVCYLANLLTLFLVPELGEAIKAGIVLPCAAAEISMVLYLLVFGVRSAPSVPAPVPTTGPSDSSGE